MTAHRKNPGGSSPGGSPGIASVTALPGLGDQGKRKVAARIAAVRAALGMTPAEFAEHLGPLLSAKPSPDMIERYERTGNAPAEVYAMLDGAPGPAALLLAPVPPAFPAGALAGPWVTVYQFAHAGVPHYHADVAVVTAQDDRLVRAVNHPPAPRTQGRASPFRNEIEGQLYGRHLIGAWRNTSDHRYYGVLQLAVLPGETVMDGRYLGVASDIEVSAGRWRWARLEADDLAGLILADAPALYELVMSRTQDDPPLTADEIREDA